MNKDTSGTREAQRRYRSRQKAKFEDFKERVEVLERKLKDLDVKNAGLTSQNRILEEAAAAVQAKCQKAADEANEQTQPVWDLRVGQSFAEYANCVRPRSMLVELSAEEGRKLTVSDLALLSKDFYEQMSFAVASPVPSAEANRTIARLLAAKRAFRDALEYMGAKASTVLISQLGCAMKHRQPTVDVVRQGVAMLQLSDEQKADLLAARRRVIRKHIAIKMERVQIVKRMQETSQRARQVDDQATSMSFLLEEVEALEELKRNLECEHVSTYSFHTTFSDTLSQFQYAKVLAYNQTHHVKPWPIVQMLAAQEAERRSQYDTCQASIQDLEQTVEFGPQGTVNPVADAQPETAASASSKQSSGSQPGASEDTVPPAAAAAAQGPVVELPPRNASPSGPAESPPGHERSDSASMSVAGSLGALLDGDYFDNVLTDLQDPFDVDFGIPANGPTEPLWNLVQSLPSSNTVGV